MTNRRKGIILMLTATVFWGFMGINSRWLNSFHISSENVAFVRCFIAALLFTLYSFIKNKNAFKTDFKGILVSSLYGVLTLGIGLVLYSVSVERIPIAVATVLMFSNPIWVSIYSALIFKERISLKSAFLIFACITGCLLLMDIFTSGRISLDPIGVLCGIGNGMTFALQIVIPKIFRGKYSSDTLLVYGFLGAAIFLFILASPMEIIHAISREDQTPFLLFNLLCIGILATFISNTFYVKSTEYIGTTLPSLMAAFDPIFASIFALIFFKEQIGFLQIIGAVIVIFSVAFLSMSDKPAETKNYLNDHSRNHTNKRS